MAIKKLKKILPITLGALLATALTVSLPLVLTSCNSTNKNQSSNENSQIVIPGSNNVENNDSSIEESVGTESGSTSTPSEESNPVGDGSQNDDQNQIDSSANNGNQNTNKPNLDSNIDSSFGQDFGDDIENNSFSALVNSNNSSKLVYGDSINFKLLPKARNNETNNGTKYTYSWKVLDLSKNGADQVIYSSNSSELNFSDFKHAGTYLIQGQINQLNKFDDILNTETHEQKVFVYPKVLVSLDKQINFKNNQLDASITPEISFEGIDQKDFNNAKSLYLFSWTKDNQSLSKNLFSTTNDQSLNIKLATENVAGNYKFTATLNDTELQQSVSATTNVTVDPASFKISLSGKNNVNIGEDVNLSANINSTRNSSSYTYSWYVKDKNSVNAQQIFNSNSSTYTLKDASKRLDNGKKYYVVAKDNSTGEVQYSLVPHEISVENTFKDNFEIGNNLDTLKVGETLRINASQLPIPLEGNAKLNYTWYVKVGGKTLPILSLNGGGHVSSWDREEGLLFSVQNDGKELVIKNNGSLKNIEVTLDISFYSQDNKLLDIVTSSKKSITTQKNNSLYKVNSQKISEFKTQMESFDEFSSLVSSGQIINNTDFVFSVLGDSKNKLLNKLGIDTKFNDNLNVTFTRVNDQDDMMTFDVSIAINNPYFTWNVEDKSSKSINLNYLVNGNVLTIKNVKTAQKTLFKVVKNELEQKSSNKKLSIKVEETTNLAKLSETINNAFFVAEWYYQDENGNIEAVKNNSKFAGVSFSEYKPQSKPTKGLESLRIGNATIDLTNVKGDFTKGSFFANVNYNHGTLESDSWEYIYKLISSFTQEGLKLVNK